VLFSLFRLNQELPTTRPPKFGN